MSYSWSFEGCSFLDYQNPLIIANQLEEELQVDIVVVRR